MVTCTSSKCHTGVKFLMLVFFMLKEGLALDLLGKTANQSSTFHSPMGDLVAGRAIDGDRSTFSRTKGEANSWWQVDLGAIYCVRNISVVNRNDINGGRLEGAVVRSGLSLAPAHMDNRMIGLPVTATQASPGALIHFSPDPFVTARYVSVDLSEMQPLHFAEVMVEEITDTEEKIISTVLQLTDKPCNQSSTYSNQNTNYGDWVACRAVDGMPLYEPPYCSRTNEEMNPWWRVDLVDEYCLGNIAVRNRDATNSVMQRLEDGVVRAGLSHIHTDNKVCGAPVTYEQALSRDWIEFTCDPRILARYVSVDIPGTVSLALCEVTVSTCDFRSAGNVVDVTLVTNPALMGPTGDNDATMTVFKGPHDVSAGILFGRQVRTGGSNDGLPKGSSVAADSAVGCGATLVYQLPEEGGIDRTGVFFSDATKETTTTTIQTVILNKEDHTVHVRPVRRTQTAYVGEPVMLQMLNVSSPNSGYRWRYNGGGIIDSSKGQLSVSIPNVSVTNKGVYSCFVEGYEHQQRHGFMRLIVQGCPAGMWGPPSCQNTCRRCYNGGICDDKTGSCICAPGFSGQSCEKVHGRHVFGKNASHSCSDSPDPHNDACRGRLFCLPDPYGCSCAAGYTGLDCMQECEAGMYGADCKQTCHCASEGACLKDTGECRDVSSGCQSPYFGENCQCSADHDVLGFKVASGDPHQLFVTWQPDPCASGYRLEYELTNRGQCEEIVLPQRVPVQDTLSGQVTYYFITGLESYSNYAVYVRPQYKDELGPEMFARGTTLRRNDPTSVSPLEVISRDSGSVTVSWRPVVCTEYYDVVFALSNLEGCEPVVQVTFSRHCACPGSASNTTISGLSPNSMYEIQVNASVAGVRGPLASTFVKTNTAKPREPPVQVTIASVGQRSLSFSWSEPPCGSRGGIITGYKYVLSELGSAFPKEVDENVTTGESVTIEGLTPYTEYSLIVAARTSAGYGPYNDSAAARTYEAEPTVPLNVNIQNVDDVSITLEWSEPDPPQGIITGYNARYWRLGQENEMLDANVTEMMLRLIDLQTNVTYFIEVQAKTSVGAGPWSEAVNATTKIGVPGLVQNLREDLITDTSVTLHWDPPRNPRGRIMYYIVELRAVAKPYQPGFTAAKEFFTNEVQGTSYVNDSLHPATEYEFRISARNQKFKGSHSALKVYTKPQPEPPAPPQPTFRQEEVTDATVTIGLPARFPGDEFIESFVVWVLKLSPAVRKREVLIPKYSNGSADDYIAAELPKQELPDTFVVGDGNVYGGYYNAPLVTDAKYEIRIGSVSRGNEAEASVTYSDPITVTAKATVPDPPQLNAGVVAVAVLVPIILVICIVIVIIVYRRGGIRKATNSSDADGMLQSAAIPLDQISASETLESSNDYVNDDKEERISTPKPKPRIKTKPTQKAAAQEPPADDEEQKVFTPLPPVRVDELAEYIYMKESSGEAGFKADYKTLPDAQLHPWTVAKKTENKAKNRYVNVVAYDYSRVVLKPLDTDPHSDYINACYIDGYTKSDNYIASQGPNKASIQDIWRMVWQLNVDKIVMLTNPVENGKMKCLQYWADTGSATYADIVVTTEKEEVFLDYTVRIFCIHKVASKECIRFVKQFYYTTWPDMKPPEHPAPLLNFMRIVNAERNEGRTVVHCSAGVGRTGTYIALDSLLEQMKVEGQVDVLGFIYRMRQKRIKMVQTPEQYKFIFDALLAASLSGDTTYNSADFRNRLPVLKRKGTDDEETGLEKQFKTLSKLTVDLSNKDSVSGQLPENANKNRFPDSVPSDRKRPFLMTKVSEDDTNYINATFLPSYRKKDTYIGTQMPMPNTVADIWRLVYDQKVTGIVMLNSLDTADETMSCYWPEEESIEFGPLVVELIQTKEYRGVTERTFSLKKNSKLEPASTVTHLQCRDWPTDQEVPGSFEGLLTLMHLTQKWHEDKRPIVVHCIDGLGCTAVYCTLMTVLEQFKAEKVVDVFQAAHRLRMVNATMMYSAAHYAMCYDVFQAYLDCITIYENVAPSMKAESFS